MKLEKDVFLPAHKADLITREIDGELLVYDRESDKAHCLNPLAARIWKHCDGRTPPSEIARLLSDRTHVDPNGGDDAVREDIDERLVWLGLSQLRQKDLLKVASPLPGQLEAIGRMSRREAMRSVGIAAAVALPLVSTIISPTPAQAATCKGNGQACTGSAECCSGICNPPGSGTCVGGPPAGSGRRR